ncbi:MAG: acetolactate decarboxylase [bacterium]
MMNWHFLAGKHHPGASRYHDPGRYQIRQYGSLSPGKQYKVQGKAKDSFCAARHAVTCIIHFMEEIKMRIARCLLTVLPLAALTAVMSGCMRHRHCLLHYTYPEGNSAIYLPQGKDILFQVSTIDALLGGIYDGEVTCEELKKHGDFGIGTFDGLDGEMIEIEGNLYQVRADGVACLAADSTKVPFAAVTFFEPDEAIAIDKPLDYKQLEHYLDTLLPTKNIFYAIKITGEYDYIKTRSVPRQNKPYPPLVEVVKDQPTFEFRKVKGTVAGFRCPEYVKGINVPSYHLHFITEDGKAGGHLLACRIKNVRVGIDHTSAFYMALPEGGEFYQAHLTRAKEQGQEQEKEQELNRVEKEH